MNPFRAARRRVLVAEPHSDTRELYREALQLAGCEVLEAFDGRDGLTKALTEPPTLIITELHLPLMDGFALCDILRQDAATRSVPIVIVTGESRSTELDRIRHAGAADAVLVKPIVPDVIVSEVTRLLADGSNGQSGRGAPAGVNGVMPSGAPANAPTRPGRRGVLVRSHARFCTTIPPAAPPALTCPSCDQSLTYERSYIGGVSSQHPEQWDEFSCGCGTFEYRHRTRRLRRVE